MTDKIAARVIPWRRLKFGGVAVDLGNAKSYIAYEIGPRRVAEFECWLGSYAANVPAWGPFTGQVLRASH